MATKKDNSKGAAKSTPKSAAKPAVKSAAKPAAKVAAKPTAKPIPKSAAKPAAPTVKLASNAKPVAATKPAANGKPAAANGKPAAANGKPPAKPEPKIAVKAPAKAPAKAATPAPSKAAVPAPTNGKPTGKAAGKVDAKASVAIETKAPAAKLGAKPGAKTEAKVAAKPAAKPASKPASAGKSKGDPMDPPSVPKKGPIDLAQHKSVAAAAAAVANARDPAASGDFIIINGRRVRAISTKGLKIAKKSKDTSTAAEAAPTEQQIASIKTKLSKKELEDYRTLLLVKRRQLFGMLSGMEDEALRSSGGNLSNMPVHMADMGSDVYDQDFTLGMAETERAILAEIDAALQRIEDKTFGVCQMTGKPISKARLDAKPWAKYTIEAERIAESSGGR